MKKETRFVLCLMIFALAFGIVGYTSANFAGPYEMQNWNSSGIPPGGIPPDIPYGTTSITPSSGSTASAVFGYNVSLLYGGGVKYRTATFSTTAAHTGTISFDWVYSFHHAWYNVYADFYVFADSPSGTTTIHLVDFQGYGGQLTYTGSSTIGVKSGYKFGFIVGGSNYDYFSFLQGNLTISNFIQTATIDIDIDPNTLNLKSSGKWVTAYIESTDFDVEDIDIGTVKLEGTITAETQPVEVGDYDNDGIPDLMVKFNRQALIEYLDGLTGPVELTVSGLLYGSIIFNGSDTIEVINPKK